MREIVPDEETVHTVTPFRSKSRARIHHLFNLAMSILSVCVQKYLLYDITVEHGVIETGSAGLFSHSETGFIGLHEEIISFSFAKRE